MRLNPAAFNRFLPMMGQHVTWRRGFACPCVNVHTGQPDHSCLSCEGHGRIWDTPVDAGRVGICGKDMMGKWAKFGQYSSGDVMLSIQESSPLYGIGPFDRVTLSDRSEPFSDALVVGVNTRLRSAVLSIDRVLWKDDAGNIVSGAIPALGEGGTTLVWDSDAPPVGVTISVTGRRGQEFYCYQDQPFDRPNHGGARLPRRIVLKSFDLFQTG